MQKYNLFISHSHSDALLASEFADFVRLSSSGRIHPMVSSDPMYGDGAKIARPLNEELLSALKTSDGVVLLYTDPSKNWEYCLWECFISTEPETARSNVCVVQLGDRVPRPFESYVRVEASNKSSVANFVNQLLIGKDFFPDQTEPLTGLEIHEVQHHVDNLFDLLDRHRFRPDSNSHNWPTVTIEVPTELLNDVDKSPVEVEKILMDSATIVDYSGISSLFAARLERGQRFGDFVQAQITADDEQQTSGWFAAIYDQISQQISKVNIRIGIGHHGKCFPILIEKIDIRDLGIVRFLFYFLSANGYVEVTDRNDGVLIENGVKHVRMRTDTLRTILSFAHNLPRELAKHTQETTTVLRSLGEKVAMDLNIEGLRELVDARVQENIYSAQTSYGSDLASQWVRLEQEAGWGRINLSLESDGTGTLEIMPTFTITSDVGESYCAFLEGYFGQVVSLIYNTPLQANQVRCRKDGGGGFCVFEVTPSARKDGQSQ